ncbi:MAG: hypothetical protein PUI18_02835 [Prevotellaceae bacterium]|nr:hypothetical protein [Prevotellaceae bacterium]
MLSSPLAPDLSLGALCLMPSCEEASINSLQKTSASVAFCAVKAHEQPLGVWRLARGQPQNIFLKKMPDADIHAEVYAEREKPKRNRNP